MNRREEGNVSEDEKDENLLDIGAVTSAVVYVVLVDKGAAFASDESGPYFTRGIDWRCRNTPLEISFRLGEGVVDLWSSCDQLSFGPVVDRTQSCIAQYATSKTQYRFLVRSEHGTHDPKIVVTPI